MSNNTAVEMRENNSRFALAAVYIRRKHPVLMVQNLRSWLIQAAAYPAEEFWAVIIQAADYLGREVFAQID